ncbi:molybdopterin-containing oxidoreductase family protein [Heliorestis convoluta]|uniref:Molybdopterin oxidoreductase n=1 Tax=Heliorestis convoluta TaxID=356322 RepID=A0A5Q2N0J4_9FIRM|nr:molybdopterin-dependent oxidoreductase [Heliorestis convoluta]QGG47066.1 molybdopterin oxidoreductase [Heliorestis convoluta]
MKQKALATCPLRCYDLCSFQVHVEEEKITAIEGNPQHMVTKGFLCSRAQALLQRHNSMDRITTPLLRKQGHWLKISWEEALSSLAEALEKALGRSGPPSILHIPNNASTGLLKKLDQRFFNSLGGITRPYDSPSYSAGVEAQKADFGLAVAPPWSDLVRARTILLWGRHVTTTNIHLLPYLLEAKEKGAKIISINPLPLAGASEWLDQHIAIQPGTDGLLALGMAQVILQERWWDSDFIAQHVEGFSSYAQAIVALTPEKIAPIVGLEASTIRQLARQYARNGRPSAIVIGAGLQKYGHSGLTIRALNALALLTGQIGVPGGAIHLANLSAHRFAQALTGEEKATRNQYVHWADLAHEILARKRPIRDSESNLQSLQDRSRGTTERAVPIEVAVITGANPISQMAQSMHLAEAFHSIPFKVVIDYHLTDTAQLADLILPASTAFETEDLYLSPWNDYIHYQKAIEKPRGKVRPEYQIWQELARRLQQQVPGLQEDQAFWEKDPQSWLQATIEQAPFTLADLEVAPRANPHLQVVPFQDKNFATSSGKANLLPGDKIPLLAQACENIKKERSEEKRQKHFRLITLHSQGRQNSQFWELAWEEDPADGSGNEIWLEKEEAKAEGLRPGDKVVVETEQGTHIFTLRVDEQVPQGTAVLYQGLPSQIGGGINKVTAAQKTDLGHGVAYYQTLGQIRKVALAELISTDGLNR